MMMFFAWRCSLLLLGVAVVQGFAPPEVQWASSGGGYYAELTASMKDVAVLPRCTMKAYTLGGAVPAPTLRMQRCGTYSLKVSNELGQPTNLHTHGLHVSPTSPGDDVTTSINSGSSHTYVYRVPCDHAGGLMWAHAHKHSYTTAQATGGLAGAVIVADSAAEYPTTEAYDFVTGAPEHVLVVSRVEPGTLTRAANSLVTFTGAGCPSFFYLVNGLTSPTFSFDANTWQRFRVVHIDPSSSGVAMTLASSTGDAAQTCSYQLLAKVCARGHDRSDSCRPPPFAADHRSLTIFRTITTTHVRTRSIHTPRAGRMASRSALRPA